MSIAIQSQDEILPGYILAERIGSGGYAEVWRVRAPGGIDKAVKIVNGYYDEEFACQEMKALERIKDVRHPFLLSLERFEVVGGRLAILTELADMSLEQRAQGCRAQGLPGIPRQELLRYMSDTAEAIDYLVQRHALQHLDIKPANLLILGDHVKVADFGLVKELATRTQNSLVAGMTPTYASPEMFDDSPSSNSDQYSLAIVYQEMLVGARAFPGRTAAQLAKQHTQAQPQLVALPASDRPIVARALAKNPAERYPSCRDFVEALINANNISFGRSDAIDREASAKSGPPKVGRAEVLEDTKSGAISNTQPNIPAVPETFTQPIGRGQSSPPVVSHSARQAIIEAQALEETVDVAVPSVTPNGNATPPTLFIAAGGIGLRILRRLNEIQEDRRAAGGAVETNAMIAFDTDRSELKEACSQRWTSPLAMEDTLHVPLRLPQDYGDDSRGLLTWLSRRWLYNIPRSLETQGYRPLGRIALVDHSEKVFALLDRKRKRLQADWSSRENQASLSTIRVILVAGMGGGTGAGMAIDLANAARARARAVGFEAEVQGILVGTCLGAASSSVLAAANTYALLTELDHASRFGNRGALSQSSDEHPFESHGAPFDHVYCVPNQSRTKEASADELLNEVATYLSLETTVPVYETLRSCRQVRTPKEETNAQSLSLRSFGCAPLSEQRRKRADQMAIELALQVKRYWLDTVPENEWHHLTRQIDMLHAQTPVGAEGDANQPDGVSAVQAVATVNPVDQARRRFGSLETSRFALEVISRLVHHSNRPSNQDAGCLTTKKSSSLLTAAAQILAVIRDANTQSLIQRDGSAVDKSAIVAKVVEVSQRALPGIIDKLATSRGDTNGEAQEVERLLAEECSDSYREPSQASRSGGSEQPFIEEDVRKTLERASVDLLQCGGDRRTLLVVSQPKSESTATEAVAAARPTAAVLGADVNEEFIICETAGIRPRSVAIALERVYPGIAEAAGRLLTRVDIDWQPLV